MIYTKENPTWKDEAGTDVPFSRTTALERKKEKDAARLLREAASLNTTLATFKQKFEKVCTEIYTEAMQAAKADASQGKGNFTWFSFDRTIKVEVSISDRIDFDDVTIQAAKIKLNEYLTANLGGVDEALRALINSAFETSRGKLDAKKVLGLLKHKSRIKAEKFQDAMKLIEQSIRRPDSRTYYRISERQEDGSYKIVDLNFSSI